MTMIDERFTESPLNGSLSYQSSGRRKHVGGRRKVCDSCVSVCECV